MDASFCLNGGGRVNTSGLATGSMCHKRLMHDHDGDIHPIVSD